MAWKQLITPNLDDDPKKPVYIWVDGKIATSWVGWCLAAVKAAYGATKSMGTALKAWNADQTKHSGSYDLPDGLYVPIYWKGDKEGYGHVAIAKRQGANVTIWSSPTSKQGGATFVKYSGATKATIDKTAKTYGCTTYLGWTERVCEKTVIQAVNLKSNEEICAEVWAGLWGTGTDRKNRLTAAGYDYNVIQGMVDDGVGKPESQTKPLEPTESSKGEETMNEPTKPEEPTQNGSSEATEPTTTNSPALNKSDNLPISGGSLLAPDSEIKTAETADGDKGEFVPATAQDGKYIDSIIEQASTDFNPPKTVKLIAYLVGDAFLVGSLLLPDIINTIQAPTPNIWAEYLSKVLLEAGVAILVVFKLFKRKK